MFANTTSWFWLAVIFIGVSAGLSFTFGTSMGETVLTCALVGLAFGALPFLNANVFSWFWEALSEHQWVTAGALTPLLLVGLLADGASTFGAASAIRTTNVNQGLHQDMAHRERQEALQSNKALLAKFETDLIELEAANQWMATVSADGLRAQLRSMEGDYLFSDERTKGCTDVTVPESREFCDRYADVEAQIAAVERREGIVDQMMALRRVVAESRDQAVATTQGTSAAHRSNVALASFAGLTLQPDDDTLQWTNLLVSWGLALLLLIAGSYCWTRHTIEMRRRGVIRPAAPRLAARRDPEPEPEGWKLRDLMDNAEETPQAVAPSAPARPSTFGQLPAPHQVHREWQPEVHIHNTQPAPARRTRGEVNRELVADLLADLKRAGSGASVAA